MRVRENKIVINTSPIKPLIEKMLQKGIWIKKEIIEGILKEAGEIEA